MRLYFFLLLSSTLFTGCSSDQKLDAEYVQLLKYFGKNRTAHFPKENAIVIKSEYTIDTFCVHNSESFFITLQAENELLNDLKHKYSGYDFFDSQDSCVIVVNDFIRKDNCDLDFYAYQSAYNKGCIDSRKVIPNFWYAPVVDNSTKSKLPKDYKFCVLDSKLGKFSKKIKYENSSLPNEISHGYSKGIAINEKTNNVVYWVQFW